MERRSFLKGLLGTSAAIAIPTTIVNVTEKSASLQSSSPPLFSSDVKEWAYNIQFLIKSFSDNVDYAWKRKDVNLLPTTTYWNTSNKIEGMIYYTQKEDNFPISDALVDNAFTSLIKYELLMGNYTMSKNKLNSWKHIYKTPKDEFMKLNDKQTVELFTKLNKTYLSLAKEVNLAHRVKNLSVR